MQITVERAVHVAILFYNIGPYHIARLESARTAIESFGGRLSAIQVAAETSEHPWGAVRIPEYVTTLLPYQPGSEPNLDAAGLLSGALDRLKPDAVAIPGWGFDFARSALRWCRRRGARRILMSESHYYDAPRTWWKEKAKWWLALRHCNSALVGGALHAEYLRRLGFPADRIFFGYDVVDNEGFAREVDAARQAGQRPADAPSEPYFLASSRFIPRKNLGRLIAAFAQAKGRLGGECRQHLVILGDGPLKPDLLNLVDANRLNGTVHFPGFVTRAEVISWLAFADGLIHPALHEQWGLVVNEAMAAALPVALSRTCGCFPELLVEGVTGVAFDPRSIEAIQGAIEALVRLGDRRREFGLAAATHLNTVLPTRRFGEGLVAAIRAAEPAAK